MPSQGFFPGPSKLTIIKPACRVYVLQYLIKIKLHYVAAMDSHMTVRNILEQLTKKNNINAINKHMFGLQNFFYFAKKTLSPPDFLIKSIVVSDVLQHRVNYFWLDKALISAYFWKLFLLVYSNYWTVKIKSKNQDEKAFFVNV